MNRTALNMKKLIDRKYYTDAEVARSKLDLLMLASRISDSEYTDLIILVDTTYAVPAPTETSTDAPTNK